MNGRLESLEPRRAAVVRLGVEAFAEPSLRPFLSWKMLGLSPRRLDLGADVMRPSAHNPNLAAAVSLSSRPPSRNHPVFLAAQRAASWLEARYARLVCRGACLLS